MVSCQMFLTVLCQTPENPNPRRLTNSYKRHLCSNRFEKSVAQPPRRGVRPKPRSVNSTYGNGKRKGALRVYSELPACTRLLARIPATRFWGVGLIRRLDGVGYFRTPAVCVNLCVYWQFSIGSCPRPRCWWPRTARNSTSDLLYPLRFSRESPACCAALTPRRGVHGWVSISMAWSWAPATVGAVPQDFRPGRAAFCVVSCSGRNQLFTLAMSQWKNSQAASMTA